MISLDDYFMGRDKTYPSELNAKLRENAGVVVARINALIDDLGKQGLNIAPTVASGWRPLAINAALPNAARASKHLTCQAVDLKDTGGRLGKFLMSGKGLVLLELHRLWMEHPGKTPTWCHLQIVAPGSGNRVFWP